MENNIKAQHWILKWIDDNPNHTKEEALIALKKAKEMENKQTAVNWLGEQIIKFHKWKESEQLDENKFDEIDLLLAIRKAKQMEKEQIKLAFNESRKIQDSDEISITHDWNNSEQYYNETYGK